MITAHPRLQINITEKLSRTFVTAAHAAVSHRNGITISPAKKEGFFSSLLGQIGVTELIANHTSLDRAGRRIGGASGKRSARFGRKPVCDPRCKDIRGIVAAHRTAAGTFPILRFCRRIGGETNQRKDGGRDNSQPIALVPFVLLDRRIFRSDQPN